MARGYPLASSSFSFFMLSTKFIISLVKMEAIKPAIPNFGTKKKIKLIETSKSTIFTNNTPIWASNPFKMLSTIISKYIKGTTGAKILIYSPYRLIMIYNAT